MEVLYPDNGSKVLVPVELDGSRGHMVVEVAHRDHTATVHWDLDGNYLGATVGEHRMALSPPDGDHLLTLTDDAGHILRRSFTVVNGARNASVPHAP
jgi:penicillin-binding protein 1C